MRIHVALVFLKNIFTRRFTKEAAEIMKASEAIGFDLSQHVFNYLSINSDAVTLPMHLNRCSTCFEGGALKIKFKGEDTTQPKPH